MTAGRFVRSYALGKAVFRGQEKGIRRNLAGQSRNAASISSEFAISRIINDIAGNESGQSIVKLYGGLSLIYKDAVISLWVPEG
jgi:hypothetical protein